MKNNNIPLFKKNNNTQNKHRSKKNIILKYYKLLNINKV